MLSSCGTTSVCACDVVIECVLGENVYSIDACQGAMHLWAIPRPFPLKRDQCYEPVYNQSQNANRPMQCFHTQMSPTVPAITPCPATSQEPSRFGPARHWVLAHPSQREHGRRQYFGSPCSTFTLVFKIRHFDGIRKRQGVGSSYFVRSKPCSSSASGSASAASVCGFDGLLGRLL
jgi:hypothetical protein